MTDKVSKEDAGYEHGHLHSHCGPMLLDDRYYCKFFESKFRGKPYREGTCSRVAGQIGAGMWCELFRKVGT